MSQARNIIYLYCHEVQAGFNRNVIECSSFKAKRISSRLGLSGLTGGFLLLQNFSVAISVSPHVCFILALILISMFLR